MLPLFSLCRPCTESFRPLFSLEAHIDHSWKVIILGMVFPGSGKVIFLGTSLSLHILVNYFRAGSVSFMTNPFIYMEGWQFWVYPTKTLQGTGLQTKMPVQDSFQAIPRAVYLPDFTAAAQSTSYRCKLHLGFYLLSFLQPRSPSHYKAQAKAR